MFCFFSQSRISTSGIGPARPPYNNRLNQTVPDEPEADSAGHDLYLAKSGVAGSCSLATTAYAFGEPFEAGLQVMRVSVMRQRTPLCI